MNPAHLRQSIFLKGCPKLYITVVPGREEHHGNELLCFVTLSSSVVFSMSALDEQCYCIALLTVSRTLLKMAMYNFFRILSCVRRRCVPVLGLRQPYKFVSCCLFFSIASTHLVACYQPCFGLMNTLSPSTPGRPVTKRALDKCDHCRGKKIKVSFSRRVSIQLFGSFLPSAVTTANLGVQNFMFLVIKFSPSICPCTCSCST